MKWIGWIGKTAITAVLIAGLSVFTTWYTVNQYIQQILHRVNIDHVAADFKISDFMSQLSNGAHILKEEPVKGTSAASTGMNTDAASGAGYDENANVGAAADEASSGVQSITGDAEISGNQTTSADEANFGSGGDPASLSGDRHISSSTSVNDVVSEDEGSSQEKTSSNEQASVGANSGQEGNEALPVFGQQDMNQDLQARQKILISAEDLYRKKEEISNEDKMSIFSLLAAKLPQQELQHISTMMENGLTSDELGQIEQILSTYLKTEEMNKLTVILNKY